jgi:hypothetical protein
VKVGGGPSAATTGKVNLLAMLAGGVTLSANSDAGVAALIDHELLLPGRSVGEQRLRLRAGGASQLRLI